MEDKKGNQVNKDVCKTGQCGCSANQIWLGIAVIIIVMAIAIIFGN